MSKKPRYVYEVYCPMPYCEVYEVVATSKREAQMLMDKHARSGDFPVLGCIGEVSSRKKQVRKIREWDKKP